MGVVGAGFLALVLFIGGRKVQRRVKFGRRDLGRGRRKDVVVRGRRTERGWGMEVKRMARAGNRESGVRGSK